MMMIRLRLLALTVPEVWGPTPLQKIMCYLIPTSVNLNAEKLPNLLEYTTASR